MLLLITLFPPGHIKRTPTTLHYTYLTFAISVPSCWSADKLVEGIEGRKALQSLDVLLFFSCTPSYGLIATSILTTPILLRHTSSNQSYYSIQTPYNPYKSIQSILLVYHPYWSSPSSASLAKSGRIRKPQQPTGPKIPKSHHQHLATCCHSNPLRRLRYYSTIVLSSSYRKVSEVGKRGERHIQPRGALFLPPLSTLYPTLISTEPDHKFR